MRDLYSILGVSNTATGTDLARAYRRLLRRYHPDTRAPGDPAQDALSDSALRQVLAAYAVLGDPGRRADYDRRARAAVVVAPPPVDPRPVIRASRRADQPPIAAGPVLWLPPR